MLMTPRPGIAPKKGQDLDSVKFDEEKDRHSEKPESTLLK